MKRNALVIASIAVLSTSAHASKARMEALNQDSVRGSEYISDTRNIFRNPALLNDTKNYLITEWGTAANADDSSFAPRAEGGFFREMGTFNYGLYLGNDEATLGRTGAANEFLAQDNALDLFLSGDMGVKWGARIHYANSKDESLPAGTPIKRENSAFGIGLGAVMGDIEGYLNLTLADKSTGAAAANDQFKTKPSYLVGGSYKWLGNTFFANYEAAKYEVTGTVDPGTTKDNTFSVGVGRVHELNPTARLISGATLAFGSTKTTAGKEKFSILPVTLGFETDATSWLILRGSIQQNVFLNNEKDVNGRKSTIANTSDVAAGATLNFGKLKVDGMIGTTTTQGAHNANSETGVLSTDNLLTRVGVTYWF